MKKKKLEVIIPAAGKSSRFKTKESKIFYKINGITLIEKIINKVSGFSSNIIFILQNKDVEKVRQILKKKKNIKYKIIIQKIPNGMGSAINLGIQKIREINFAVIWADQIYISNKTISKTLTMHFKKKADLTFPIKKIRKPYTNVIFDIHGKFKDIKQMREQNKKPKIGINDCGFFVCKSKIFKVLLPELIKKNLIRSKKTKEYDFLHSFKFLNNNKIYNVMASKKIETLGINKLKDLKTV